MHMCANLRTEEVLVRLAVVESMHTVCMSEGGEGDKEQMLCTFNRTSNRNRKQAPGSYSTPNLHKPTKLSMKDPDAIMTASSSTVSITRWAFSL